MKITRTLNVSLDDFYSHLEEELVSKCHQHDHDSITTHNVKKGLKYIINHDDIYKKTTITVLEYVRNEFYKVQITSMSDMITISYKTEISPKGIEVVFIQDIASFSNKKQSNVMRLFSEAVYYGRMSDTLFDIQKKIHSRNEA